MRIFLSPMFKLGEPVYICREVGNTPGVIGGVTIVGGIEYLVVRGDDLYASPSDTKREWWHEGALLSRSPLKALAQQAESLVTESLVTE